MKRIVIISPLATVAPHFETELEIAQRHIDDGDQVEWLECQGGLSCCDFNVRRETDRCDTCVGRRWAGIDMLDLPVARLALAEHGRKGEVPASALASIDALRGYRVGEFDIGYGVLSSLVSITRDPQPDLEKHRLLIQRLYRAAWATYSGSLEYCRKHKPDRVYVFNGRFAATRAVLRACQVAGVDCWIHERGCDWNHFQLFENRLPHDIEYMQQRIRDAWQAAENNPDRDSIAASWFTDRVARVERNWHSFVKHQSRGRLPRGWNPAVRNIAIFTSSEDEFVSIGESWKNPFYENQAAALRKIIDDLEPNKDEIQIYVRVHPNQRKVDNEYSRSILSLSAPGVTVIPPNDSTDSYELLRRCEKVVTFGSSIGIEAVFCGTPSVLLGPCFYRGFPGIYQPTSHAEAIEMMTARLEPAADRSGALMYGYWFQTQGTRFRYFEATGLFEGRFRGRTVFGRRRRAPWNRLVRKIRRLLRVPAA